VNIPQPDRLVKRPTDELRWIRVVELDATDPTAVAFQGVEAFSGRRPQLDLVVLISAAADKLRAVWRPFHAQDFATVALQIRQALALFWVPQDDPAVIPAARENLAVERKGDRPDNIAVAFQGVEAFSGRPQLDLVVSRSAAADRLRAIPRTGLRHYVR